MKKKQQRISIVSRGSRYQVSMGVALLTVIPLMTVFLIAFAPYFFRGSFSWGARALAGGFAGMAALSGYLILRQYPKNILKLRKYLKLLAEGELPDEIKLLNSEDDLKAIENYLNTLLGEMRRKVRVLETQLGQARAMKTAIEAQQQELLDAERHRVMIQSLGAACHHIGQPATVLRANLHLLKSRASSENDLREIEECEKAVESIADVLEKLRHISEYRTVPYRTYSPGETASADEKILDIEDGSVPPASLRANSENIHDS